MGAFDWPQQPRTRPSIQTVTLTLAATEYSVALPDRCQRYEFKARTKVDINFAFQPGKVATAVEPYSVLPSGWAYDSDVIDQSGGTIYFATAAAGTVVEVVIRS